MRRPSGETPWTTMKTRLNRNIRFFDGEKLKQFSPSLSRESPSRSFSRVNLIAFSSGRIEIPWKLIARCSRATHLGRMSSWFARTKIDSIYDDRRQLAKSSIKTALRSSLSSWKNFHVYLFPHKTAVEKSKSHFPAASALRKRFSWASRNLFINANRKSLLYVFP